MFENSYHCPHCDTHWTDEWECLCSDTCPECGAEIEPYCSFDISEPYPATASP